MLAAAFRCARHIPSGAGTPRHREAGGRTDGHGHITPHRDVTTRPVEGITYVLMPGGSSGPALRTRAQAGPEDPPYVLVPKQVPRTRPTYSRPAGPQDPPYVLVPGGSKGPALRTGLPCDMTGVSACD